MAIAARFRCAGCDSDMIVLPSMVWSTLPESARDGFLRALEDLRDEDGRRFTLADEHGRFPLCELRRRRTRASNRDHLRRTRAPVHFPDEGLASNLSGVGRSAHFIFLA
jgi:hypothetical protein